MKSMTWCFVGLVLLSNLAVAAEPLCSKENENVASCIAGDTMKCIKRFDAKNQSFIFVFSPITESGQIINANSPMYKKTVGYTPKPCTVSK